MREAFSLFFCCVDHYRKNQNKHQTVCVRMFREVTDHILHWPQFITENTRQTCAHVCIYCIGVYVQISAHVHHLFSSHPSSFLSIYIRCGRPSSFVYVGIQNKLLFHNVNSHMVAFVYNEKPVLNHLCAVFLHCESENKSGNFHTELGRRSNAFHQIYW